MLVSPGSSPSHASVGLRDSTVKAVGPSPSPGGSSTPTILDESFSPSRSPDVPGTYPTSAQVNLPDHCTTEHVQRMVRSTVAAAGENTEDETGVEFTLDPDEELLNFPAPFYDVNPGAITDQAHFTLVSQPVPQINVGHQSSQPKEVATSTSTALRVQNVQLPSTCTNGGLRGRSNSLDSVEEISKASTLSISSLSIPSKLSLISAREIEDSSVHPHHAYTCSSGKETLSDDEDMQLLKAIISEQKAILSSPDMRRALEKEKVAQKLFRPCTYLINVVFLCRVVSFLPCRRP